jgi:RNA polymerase sigma-70 factor, ECF subfamily
MSGEDDEREPDQTLHLLLQAQDGDTDAFDRVFDRHRAELRRAVARRLDRSLRGRFDPSDIVQEAHLEVLERLPEYMVRRPMPFRDWIFRTAFQRLLKIRQHALAARRDIGREKQLRDASSSAAIRPMMVGGSTPSQEASARERSIRLNHLLRQLAPPDRAILKLRTFQGLSYEEVGDRLDIDPAAARKRYGRALLRLRVLLLADGLTESRL